MQGLGPVATRSVYQEIQDRIKEHILINKLQPGDALPTEAELVQGLSASRSVVREALRSLESLGVVHSRRGEGRYVSGFSLDPIVENLEYSLLFDAEEVREILQVRECLEAGFIEAAIEAMTEEGLNELRRLVGEMRRKAENGETFAPEDLAFHRTIYEAVGNRLLLKLLGVFWHVYENLRNTSLYMPKDLKAEARKHEAILQAIEARHVELAERLLAEHFEDINARLKNARTAVTHLATEAAQRAAGAETTDSILPRAETSRTGHAPPKKGQR